MELRAACPDDASVVSDLALRSKGHWGYDEAFLEACRADLTWQPAQMDTITLAESEGEVVGFFSLVGSELDALFVTPEAIGQGFGASLLKAALSQARAQGIEAIEFDADPQAVPFYARFRAVVVGESPSTSIAGRSLPRMRIATTL